MSVKSGITVSSELASTFEQIKQQGTFIRAIKIQIQDDTMVQAGIIEGSPTKDLSVLTPLAEKDAAAYFFLHTTATKWASIIYVPEGVSKVKERMVYASTHSTIKSEFGLELISEDMRIGSYEELTKSPNIGAPTYNREDLLSKAERSIQEADRQESIARREREEDRAIKKGDIGGYHSVMIPITPEVEEAFQKFISSEINWIELGISQDQKSIELKDSSSITENQIGSQPIGNEPRYYLCKVGFKTVFVYCCPEKSLTKIRMVYSTCKPSIVESITKNGINIDSKMEVSELSEVTEPQPTHSYTPRNYSANNSNKPSLTSPHPLFGRPNAGGFGAKKIEEKSEFQATAIGVGKKKIIIPPSVAYS